MYVGRVVAVGRNRAGQSVAMYRVSSRSFPSREARLSEGAACIVPKPGHESDIFRNPYIAYNCLKIVGDVAVVTNGSHTDPVAEKLRSGMVLRDAMALSMMTLDYEKDDYNTPRIAAAIAAGAETGLLAVVRKDGLNVQELAIAPGECFYVATYEHNDVSRQQRDEFDVGSAQEAADYILKGGVFAKLEHPVSSVCAMEKEGAFELAVGSV